MDTLTIRKLLKTYRCFKGVFPCDQLPYNEKPPLNIIVNTDPSQLPGSHWIAISINKDGRGHYFDSFGLRPMVQEITAFLEIKCTKGWSHSSIQIQNITSETCGNYCVLYIIFRCQGLSHAYYLSGFTTDTIDNDKRMLKIFKNFSLAKQHWSRLHQK